MMTIGQAMKAARKRAGYTQQKLSDITGVCRLSISLYKLDKTVPKIMNLLSIADVLHISLDELVGRDALEGEWIEHYTEIKCSCCGAEFNDEVTCCDVFCWPWDRCPKCGARMKVGWDDA